MPTKILNDYPPTPPPKSTSTRTASGPELSGENSESVIEDTQLNSTVKCQAKATVPESSTKESESMIEGSQLDSTVKPHGAVLELTDSCNTAADKTSSSIATSTQSHFSKDTIDSSSDDIMQKCRIQFNVSVFGNDLQQTGIKLHGNSTKKIYSQVDINGVIEMMENIFRYFKC